MTNGALFGELRSLLQRPAYRQDELLLLLARAYEQSSSQYVDQWRPYLAQYTLPKIRVERLSDLQRWQTLLPEHVDFEFKPYGQALEQWLHHPALSRVTHLDLSHMDLGVKNMKTLVQEAHLPRLCGLNLNNNRITIDGLKQLLKAPWRAQLCDLKLYGNNIKAAGIELLASDDAFHHLRSLHLGGDALSEPAFGSMAESAALANLIELRLFDIQLDVQQLARLFDASAFRLESLGLDGCQLNDDAVGVLAQCAQLNQLKTLSLGYNKFGHKALAQLAHSEHITALTSLNLNALYFEDAHVAMSALSQGFEHLQELNLASCCLSASSLNCVGAWSQTMRRLIVSGNLIGDRGAQDIASALPSLTEVELVKCGLGEVGLLALARACRAWSLKTLCLSHNEMLSHDTLTQIVQTQRQLQRLELNSLTLNNRDVIAIAETPWTQLHTLSMAHNDISDRGMIALAQSDGLTFLQDLSVGNFVGDQGALALAASESLGQLERVWLMKNQITDVGAAALEQSKTLKQGARIDVYECPCDVHEVVVGQHETIL